MADLANTGNQIGSFLGNALTPLLGGTQSQTVTEKPSASSQTTTAIVIIVVIVVVAIVGFLVYKKSK